MKKRALKTAVIALEVVALLIAITAAAAFFLYWRLGQGPVSLGLLRPSVAFAVEQRLPEGYGAEIGSIELVQTQSRGDYRLRLADLTVFDSSRELAAHAPLVAMTFSAGDLLAGRAGPKTVLADGASFRIVRRENLQVDIPIVDNAPAPRRTGALSGLLQRGIFKNAFESAALTNAKITFLDMASGRSWTAPDTQVSLRRNDAGLVALVQGGIDMDGVRAGIDANAVYNNAKGVIDVVIEGENFPIGDILSTFYGERAAIVEAPVSGRAMMSFTPDGDVLSSRFDARMGGGFLTLGGKRRALTQIAWETGFDPISNRFTIDRFDFNAEGARGEIEGEVSISFGDDIRDPESISFALDSNEIVIDAPGILPEALPVNGLSVDGQYILTERRLSLSNLAADFAGLTAGGSVTFRLPRGQDGAPPPSPGVIADIDFEGALGPKSLLSVWPKGLAMGARDWVVDRLETAYIDNLDFEMNLAPGAVAEDGGLPDEALTLTFDARDVKAYYVKEMTPLRDGAGTGVLRGNSFLLSVRGAQVGEVPITTGEVSFPVFMPKWRPTYYRFSAEGEAQSMLSILDEAPLSLLSKVNLSADQFSGTARADVEVMRPNKRDVAQEDYGYKGTATFENMTIADLIGDINFSNASGTVDLQTRSMKVTADALLADDAPINLQWRQNFYEQDGPSDVAISGVVDSSTGDLFGISTRQFLRGPVTFEANATGDLGDFETLDVKAEFDDAALIVDALGWRKPAGRAAAGDISMSFNEAGVEVRRFSLKGDGVDIDGGLSFNKSGAIETASLPRFFLRDAADFAVTAERDPMGALDLTAVGAFLNAGPLIQQTLEGSGGQQSSLEWGRGVHVRSRIDEVAMRGGVRYRDGALDLHRDADRLQGLDFSAFGEDGKPLSVSMALTGAEDGPERAVEARSSAIGELMRGVFGIESVARGEGSMRIALHQGGAPGFSGELEARNLQVINAPLLARIFSAGSLDGLVNLMNGEGIEFSYAYGHFDYANGVVAVKDMRATGSSVGITAEGELGVGGDDATNLTGAVAPIYALNSVLGNAPIIGDILVGTKGEGIVAFNYRVSGDIGNPSVFVNPLSALTPGIFRELFQPSRTSTRTPTEESLPPADE